MESVDTPAIEFRSVSCQLSGKLIIDGLDLEVRQGELLILLGASGCGKTTTLKLINRLVEPSSGKVLVNGIDVASVDRIRLRRNIGYVLQDGGLFPHMTAEQNVGLVLRIQDSKPSFVRERCDEMLELVGLEPDRFRDRYPHELSGGQRQRIGVARALAFNPDILLLDEPFGALDAITRTSLQKEFARLVRELGKTAVFVTHDLHEAKLLGSRIALMDKGKTVLVETPENFALAKLPLAQAYLETIS